MVYQGTDGDSLAKYESSEVSVAQASKSGPKRSYTLSSNVADAHARTVAKLNAPPAPKEVNNALVYLIGITICMGAVAYGYDTGFFGGTIALTSFQRDFGTLSKSPKERDAISANLVSLFQGGSFFGAAFQLPITNTLGRKWSIIISNIIFIVSAIVQAVANGNVSVMMAGRFLGGLAIGVSSLVIPVYLSEFAPAPIRGRLIGFYDMGIQVGTLAGFWINFLLFRTFPSNQWQWRIPVLLQLAPAALLGLGMFFLPETPRFLMDKGRFDEAEAVLVRLRRLPRDHEYLQWELTQTRAQAEAEKMIRGDDTTFDLIKQLFRSRGHSYRLFLAMSLLFFKTFSGVQAVNYYSPRIFEQLGFKGTSNSLLATGVYGSVKFICTVIFGLFVVDRIGRRRPLIFGSTAGALCLFYMGGYLTGAGPRPADATGTRPGDYSAIVAIFLYASIYCFGYNSVPLTLVSEIFTMRFKTVSMTFCLMWQWLCTFAVVRIMPVALTNLGGKAYFPFAAIFITAGPFVYFLVPETKGLPLEAMDDLFGVAEMTDAERAVLANEKGEVGSVSHVEHAGYASAAAGVARTNTVQVMAPIDELARRV
ncbi:BZ3500_MvSof-1268-A1-R1_Chr10-1g02626 [Microbotryum saponariae]|uniref:Quinate transporter n=1 Tax=Microbotryum saponariae TaxID=289078 RepID=A0A2X0L9L0_9BASI|nr:BZ3500_MvSof-1268-A1-R1_Chr10-1g02626 [Microbotryum saponariae]SDA06115.1 BZ3501_MvSof-1269-A2-R1_Chr10-1g02227 [Microbotryum saponariae]